MQMSCTLWCGIDTLWPSSSSTSKLVMGTRRDNQYLFRTRWASLSPWVGCTLLASRRPPTSDAVSATTALAKEPRRQAGASEQKREETGIKVDFTKTTPSPKLHQPVHRLTPPKCSVFWKSHLAMQWWRNKMKAINESWSSRVQYCCLDFIQTLTLIIQILHRSWSLFFTEPPII